MHVMLVQPPPWRPETPGLALPYIQASLKAAGHEAEILDLSMILLQAARDGSIPVEPDLWEPYHHFAWYERDHPAYRRFIEQAGPAIDRTLSEALDDLATPPIVGVTVMEPHRVIAIELCRRIKRIRPDAFTVLGGSSCFPQYQPEAWSRDPAVDAVCVGEGEETASELARAVESRMRGAAAAWPPGLLIRRDGDFVPTGARPLIANLDTIPFPDFSGMDLGAYRDPLCLPMLWSRGCIHRCAFCIESRIWGRYRTRGAARIHEEIRRNATGHGATWIAVNDSTFNGAPAVLLDLCGRLAADGSPPSWYGQAMLLKEMDRPLLRALYAGGCRDIDYGLESASPKVLALMRKHHDIEHAERIIRETKDAGIEVTLNLMFGFPGEDERDFQVTLDFLRRMAPWINQINPCDALTGILPGTPLCDEHEAYGVTFRYGRFFWETVDGANTMPVRIDRFERLCRLAAELGIRNVYGRTELANREELLEAYRENSRRIDAD